MKKNSITKKAADLALRVTRANVNTACISIYYQPKLPKGIDKLKNE